MAKKILKRYIVLIVITAFISQLVTIYSFYKLNKGMDLYTVIAISSFKSICLIIGITATLIIEVIILLSIIK